MNEQVKADLVKCVVDLLPLCKSPMDSDLLQALFCGIIVTLWFNNTLNNVSAYDVSELCERARKEVERNV